MPGIFAAAGCYFRDIAALQERDLTSAVVRCVAGPLNRSCFFENAVYMHGVWTMLSVNHSLPADRAAWSFHTDSKFGYPVSFNVIDMVSDE